MVAGVLTCSVLCAAESLLGSSCKMPLLLKRHNICCKAYMTITYDVQPTMITILCSCEITSRSEGVPQK